MWKVAACDRRHQVLRKEPKTYLAAKWFAFALLLPALLMSMGCGSSNEAKAKRQESSRLKNLSLLYGRFLSAHRGVPPKDEAEFKGFVASLPDEAKTHIPPVDELFVSERDNQPYVIVYGKSTSGGPADIIGYEQTGVGGKRFIANSVGAVQEVDAETFSKRVPDAH